jgi:hypothetical protein
MSAPQPPSTARSRITEQVVANVLSGAILVGLLALASWGWLQLQRLFQFAVIPANLLAAVGFISLGVCLTLVVIAALLYVWLVRLVNQNPVMVLFVYLGLALAMAIHDPKMRDSMLDKLTDTPRPKP